VAVSQRGARLKTGNAEQDRVIIGRNGHFGEHRILLLAEPAERFLLVTTPAQAEALQQKLAGEAQLNDSTQAKTLASAARA
jgi:hypothetical protein